MSDSKLEALTKKLREMRERAEARHKRVGKTGGGSEWKGQAPTTATKPERQEASPRITPPVAPSPSATDVAILNETIRRLHAELAGLRKQTLNDEIVRRELLKLAEAPRRVPDWLIDTKRVAEKDLLGVPTIFNSDQHLGEVVDPAQVGGVNQYNLEIAKRRWKTCVEKTIGLCFNSFAHTNYDGIVTAYGGDGVTGTIHEELVATADADIMPTVLDLADLIVWSTKEYARAFGKVFVPCVVGNHGRTTLKPRTKNAAFTNYDWIAYHMAAKAFEGDDRVHFYIPTGSTARWHVYGHRYAMEHGDAYRGGDGIIGSIGPQFRGDVKKRARDAETGQGYDTLMLAHFHQLRMDQRIMSNGSLVGYSEWAAKNNFPFEMPKQGLWITHPRYGITFNFPVLVEEPLDKDDAPWVQWPES